MRAGWMLLILAAAWGCSGDAGVEEARPESDAETPAETPSAGLTERRDAEAASGELPDLEDVVWQVFDETPEPEGPARTTLHIIVPRDASRHQLRKALGDALQQAAQDDTTLVAIRAIGYRPEQTGPADATMVAFVWAEWLPPDGWYRSTATSRGTIHRMYFYHNLPPEW